MTKKLGIKSHFLADLVDSVEAIYGSFYNELTEKKILSKGIEHRRRKVF